MEQIQVFLDLPFEVLAYLAAGYICYRFAYTGKDGTHSAIDAIFMSAVFAVTAKTATLLVRKYLDAEGYDWPELLSILLGCTASLVIAGVWRKHLEGAVFWCLRKLGVSHSDRQNTAWQSLLARSPAKGPTQLYVRCKDGSCLLCDELHKFESLPLGPCVFGQDGSVTMYPTDRKWSMHDDWEAVQTLGHEALDPQWGVDLIYIPADQIAEIRVKYPVTL